MSETTAPTRLTAEQLRDVAAASNAAIAADRAYDRPAEEILAGLRQSLTQWQGDLTADVARFDADRTTAQAQRRQARLHVLGQVLDLIGR